MNKYAVFIVLPLYLVSCAAEPGNAEAVEAASFSSAVAAPQTASIKTITSREAKRLLAQGGMRVLDIRTPQEWVGGRLQGA